MNGKHGDSVDMQALQRVMGGSMVWVGIAFVVIMVFLFRTIRIERITGEEIGFLLNRITGEVTVIEQSGAQIFNGLTKDFYKLDRTLQTLDMTKDPKRGDRRRRDDLKIKTMDGSDVYVDLKVQYRIDPGMAKEVITTSGPGDLYKQKWARDYMRAIARNYLGELSTEEFYDSSKRDAKLVLAKNEANDRLRPFGIKIDYLVIPRRPQFYKEYEDMIKKKKLADQAVLEEKSKALAAKQKQQTLKVLETNKKNVAMEEYRGQMRQKVIAAEAEAEQGKRAADAYYTQTTIAAEATLYQREKQAKGIRVKKTKEAEGIKELKKALEGEGGRNMVKLEYARKLKEIKIMGKPFTIQSRIERFEHLKGAASTGRD
jgi:hypothetical protein